MTPSEEEDLTSALHYITLMALLKFIEGEPEPPAWMKSITNALNARIEPLSTQTVASAMMRVVERAVARPLTTEEHAYFLQCQMRASHASPFTH